MTCKHFAMEEGDDWIQEKDDTCLEKNAFWHVATLNMTASAAGERKKQRCCATGAQERNTHEVVKRFEKTPRSLAGLQQSPAEYLRVSHLPISHTQLE